MFQIEISGNDFNDEQSENKYSNILTLLIVQLEISGKDFNNEHQKINLPLL